MRQLRQPARPDRPDQPALEDRRATPEFRETKHLFLDLPKFADGAAHWIERSRRTGGRTSATSRSHLLDEIRPRPITRDLDWGVRIPVPGYAEDENKRIYVWFDAVIGYLSASDRVGGADAATPTPGATGGRTRDAEHAYFLGKDNIVFHTVIWPAMLLGYGEGRRVRRRRRRRSSCPTTSSRPSS